jgi:pilus assembly protein CpaB
MKRPAIFAACAIALALITAMMARSYMMSLQQQGATTEAPVTHGLVVVAAEDISLGTTLEERHLKAVPWNMDAVPAGAAADPKGLLGRVTMASFVTNEVILPQKLATSETNGIMSLRIPPGMRAVSVPVNKVSGVSGFIAPGTRVDVIVVIMPKGEGASRRAFTLLQDVRVLAVAQSLDQRETKPAVADTVTLLVSPDEAHRITLASAEGTLQLALRNYQDGDPSTAAGVSITELTGPAEQVAQSKTIQVELIRGPDRIVERF